MRTTSLVTKIAMDIEISTSICAVVRKEARFDADVYDEDEDIPETWWRPAVSITSSSAASTIRFIQGERDFAEPVTAMEEAGRMASRIGGQLHRAMLNSITDLDAPGNK